MVKVFKESHEKDVERLVPDHRCEIGWKETHDLQNVPKHTVVWMKGLTSPVCSSLLLCVWVWVCGLSSCFRWWPGIPVSTWNEPNRTRIVILVFGIHHTQCLDVDLSPDIRTRPISKFVAPGCTSGKKSLFDIKFVKWLVRKNRSLSMSKNDDELN